MVEERWQRWQQLSEALRSALAAMDEPGRNWLRPRLARIAALQEQLDALYRQAGGPRCCAACRGACCAVGVHHFTLANFLAFAEDGRQPPVPDFALTCPFLGPAGCRLDAAHRPFNCIIFWCEKVLAGLDGGQQEQARRLETELRTLYLEFDGRFAGSSLRGLFLGAERVPSEQLLTPKAMAGPMR